MSGKVTNTRRLNTNRLGRFIVGNKPLNPFKVGNKLALRHGMHGTPEYIAFDAAKQRCRNPKNKTWKDYGGRGIELRFRTFSDFFNEIGHRPSRKHSLDRKDNDGHYEVGNIKWSTPDEQVKNRRSIAVLTAHIHRLIVEWRGSTSPCRRRCADQLELLVRAR